MKKIKYVILAMVLMLALIGGAYAYWQESLTIEGTVSTGTMDVRITRWHPSSLLDQDPYITGQNTGISADGKTASAEIEGLYPSEQRHYQNMQLRMTNHSTIPVKLESVVVEKTGGDDTLWSQFYGSATIRIYDDTNEQIAIYGPTPGKPFSELGNEIMKLMDGVLLGPDYRIRFGNDEEDNSIRFWLEPGAGNATQDKSISFDITFNWVQFNK